MTNMDIYEHVRQCPQDALKPIQAGRLKGKSDINPMWRIKKLTEMFGPVGFGWYTEVTRQEVIPADDGNLMAFVDINLFVKDGEIIDSFDLDHMPDAKIIDKVFKGDLDNMVKKIDPGCSDGC